MVRFNSIRHDDGRVETRESVCIGEECVLSTPNLIADCDVIKDDSAVRGWDLR